jgi:hypothetical protein
MYDVHREITDIQVYRRLVEGYMQHIKQPGNKGCTDRTT